MEDKRKNDYLCTNMKICIMLSFCVLSGLFWKGACPIKKETTKITFSRHSNSGLAVYSSVTLYPDHLVWSYSEVRNVCSLRDSCSYDREEFERLVKDLSEVRFSAKDSHDHSTGGAGYAYSFETEAGQYFHYNNSFKLSGDYGRAEDLIQQFISAHRTPCELLFKKYAAMPHKRARFGEFEELPEALKKYKMK